MCSYHTLYINRQIGHVVFCTGCNTVQVAMGNIAIILTRKNFHELIRGAENLMHASEYVTYADDRSILLATPYQGIKMLLTPCELRRLKRMLCSAELELQALELMRLFYQPA